MTEMIHPALTERELLGAEISKKAAKEGMVLLKNEAHALPLSIGKIALYGNGAARTVRGGTGSGDPFNGGLSGGGDAFVNQSPRYHVNILPAMKDLGFEIVNEAALLSYAKDYDEAFLKLENRVMQCFNFPERPLSDAELLSDSADVTTAVFILSRSAGEGNDRAFDGDYCFSQAERENLAKIRKTFKKLILVLNVGGAISVRDIEKVNADAVLLMGQAGQEGGPALAEVLTGETVPSGKLTATWAYDYEDYPASAVFLKDPEKAFYEEGIYVGYRYFDTFGKKAGYPFGYGLSYTEFTMKTEEARLEGTDLLLRVNVKNTGNYAGKEVVEVYVSAPQTELDMPEKELRDFEKTGLLAPGEEETLTVTIPLKNLGSYSYDLSGNILSKGYYIVRVGNASDNTEKVAAIFIQDTVKLSGTDHVLPLRLPLKEMQGLTGSDRAKDAEGLPLLTPSLLPDFEDRHSKFRDGSVTTYTFDPAYVPALPYEKVCVLPKTKGTMKDLKEGRISMEAFVAQFTEEQLSDFVCGTGWGTADESEPIVGSSSESVPGAAGETTHELTKEFGIPSIVLADGPGGVRVSQEFEATNIETGEKQQVFHYCIAWPVGTLIAQSFDRRVAYEVGLGLRADLVATHVQNLLAPGINIQRDPLCGRNFEYFSEDPLIAGEFAAQITLGVQKDDLAGACIKHYAANNQETNRGTIDSVVSERALREIYLEPYRIAIKEAQPHAIMTSYNLLNGVPTADSYDLCTNLPRGEWGFTGLIMTDWNGGSSTPSISMHAGNDLIMPGGPTRAASILNALKKAAPVFDETGRPKKVKLVPFAEIYSLLWNSFTPSEEGRETVEAKLSEGHRAEISDGLILVDGAPVYLKAGSFMEMRTAGADFRPLHTPLTTASGSISEDGRAIIYRGDYHFTQTICLGDMQRRAAAILSVLLRLRSV